MHTRRLAGVFLLRQIPVCNSGLENKLAGRVGHPSLRDAGRIFLRGQCDVNKKYRNHKNKLRILAYPQFYNRSKVTKTHFIVRSFH